MCSGIFCSAYVLVFKGVCIALDSMLLNLTLASFLTFVSSSLPYSPFLSLSPSYHLIIIFLKVLLDMTIPLLISVFLITYISTQWPVQNIKVCPSLLPLSSCPHKVLAMANSVFQLLPQAQNPLLLTHVPLLAWNDLPMDGYLDFSPLVSIMGEYSE